MADLYQEIVDRLKVITYIEVTCQGRVYDTDYRETGWSEVVKQVFDSDGLMQPTMIVVDSGIGRTLGGTREARLKRVYVWAFANRSSSGQDIVRNLMAEAERAMLKDSFLPGVTFQFDSSLGVQTPQDGAMDRMLLYVAGIPAGS